MKRKVFSLLVLCLFAFLGLANAQSSGTVSANPDPIDLGYRPLGAWMRPFQVQLTATGAAQTITAIEADKDFFVIDANLPSTVSATVPFSFTVDHGEAAEGPVKGNLVAMTESRKAYIFDIQAVAYSPIAADVTETAPTITLPFTATVGENIYDNYLLPGDLADGKDVVYKMNITDDILFNAYVEGENGKVALYQEDFAGEPGPGATNNYTGINVGGGSGGPYEAQVGFGTNTSGYVPAYYLYNYSISQQLFLADELTLAGAAAGNINSISFYTESTYGYLMKNTSIYIGNTTAATVTDQSPSIANMTLVYSGNYQQVVGWNEFEFSTPFAWDGTSNVLVLFIMNNGNWSSSIAWQTHNPGFMASAYQYRDGDPFDPATPVSMYTSSTLRANTIFKGVARSASPMNVNITDMTLTPGVYYLAASSTSDEFTVNVNTDELPVPEPAYNPYPADGDVDITTPVTLTWNFGNYTTAYRLLLGTTYPPTEVVVDWTNELANGYYTGELINNKNYFWRVDEKNTNGITEGEVWGFTTTLNIPTGLAAVDEKIYVGDNLQLYWDQVEDRSYRGYNVYQDGVKINTELVTTNEYTVSGLTYNTDAGYVFNVTAVYDEGESNFSSDLIAFVSGNGTISGKVTEVDGTTGIAGADIVFEGLDEFLRPVTYTFTTGANGTYTGAMKKGTYNGIAIKEGYQGAEYEGEVTINYNTTTPNINFILKEIWYPLGEVIAEEVDENQVKVYWSANIMSEIIESFETGDFSAFDWVNDAAHPWVITTTNPYDGEYCVRSGNQNVNSSSSVLQVSVEINRDGLMSFYGKASSEQNWDYGYFYIDGTQKASFTGAGNWVKKEYPITAGVHTFKWEYTKDGSVSSNDDCLYIDYISFIHDAEPVVPDGPGTWYYYDNGVNEDAIGTGGGNFSWAVMFPAGSYTGTAVTKVSAFDYMAMDGTVTIYNDGATAPASPVGTRDVSFEGSEDFVEFPFSSPVAIDASKNLWVVFYNGSGATYPAAVCANTGDANGRWVSIDGVVWEDMATYSLDYTFMVRAFVSTGAKGEVQEITLNNQPHTGGTLAAAGVAKANNTRAFDHYNIYRTTCDDMTGENAEFLGSINDTIYLDNDWASLEPGIYKWGVSKFYQGNRGGNRVVYDFENNLSGWTTIDANNDGITWCDLPGINNVTSYYVGMTLDWYHGGSNAAISGSYINGIGALNPDEYLVSPLTSISNGTTISFWTAACDPSYAADHFGVFVSTGSATNPSDFVSVQEWTLTGKSSRAGKSPASREGRGDRIGTWYNYTVDLSAYAGQNVYIAFRHFNCYDQYIMCIDDVEISGGGDNPNPPTPPTPPAGGDITYTGVEGESGVLWSNCLENKMTVSATVTVSTNSGDPVEGTTVTLNNINEAGYTYNVTLDETGTYTWETMRRGTYEVNVNLDGFTPIAVTEEIGDNAQLTYVLQETIAEVSGLYVSATGWAMFGDVPAPPTPVDPVDPPVDPTEGQWYYYDNGANEDAIGTGGGNFYWGVMFPAGSYTGNAVIKVSAYDYMAMTGDVTIYNDGAAAPSNPVGTTNVTFTGSSDFVEFEFASPVIIDPSKNVWVVFYNGSGATYPAAVCANTGDANGRWVSIDGTEWMDLASAGLSNTFMVRAYIAGAKGEVNEIAYTPKPCDGGTLSKAGVAKAGRSIEYYKVMLDGVLEGTTTNPFFQHNVEGMVEGETHTTAVQTVYTTGESEWAEFEWVYSACDNYEGLKEEPTAQWQGEDVVLNWVLPEGSGDNPNPPTETITWDFESNLSGWTTIDANNDGYTWCDLPGINNYTDYYVGMTLDWYHGGSNAVISGSYINGIGALSPDDYLVSPQVTISNGSTFSFWTAACDPSYAADHFGVFVSTGSATNPADFTSVQEWTLTGKSTGTYRTKNNGSSSKATSRDGKGDRIGTWYHYSVDLSAYAGQQVYIAFRHFNCYDQYIMCIDDAELSGSNGGDDPNPPTPPTGTATIVLNVPDDIWGDGTGYQMLLDADATMYTQLANVSYFSDLGSFDGFEYTIPENADYGVYANNVVIQNSVAIQIPAGVYDYAIINPDNYSTIWFAGTGGNTQSKGDDVVYEGNKTYTYTIIGSGTGDGINLTVTNSGKGNRALEYDFESNLSGWTTIDANNDGYTWCDLPGINNYTSYYVGMTLDWYHGGSNAAISGSYINGIGALSPDDYLVSPQVSLSNGSNISFWTAACDPSYAADHFGVFVSTGSATNPADFVSVQEWTLTGKASRAGKSPASREGRGDRIGTWYNYTVDLSAYAGQNVYIAFRHFNCYDQYIMCIDDVTINAEGGDTPVDPPVNPTESIVWDFESNMSGWSTIDANNDGYTWCDLPGINNYTDYYVGMTLDWYHGGSNAVISGSYINGIGALSPDDYLVSPQVTIGNGATFSFWTAACDPSYAADHFGVFVSTGSATNPADFVSVQEWTLTGKSTRAGKAPASRDGKGDRIGTWYHYSVDLSAYAGQQAYIAFRHFNCYDQYIMAIDDAELTGSGDPVPPTPGANVRGVEIFRDGVWIAEVAAPAQTYTDINPGEVDEYEIRVVYNGNMEDYSHYTMSCPQVCVPEVNECLAPENLTGSYEYFNNEYFGAMINWNYSGEVSSEVYSYDGGATFDGNAAGLGGGSFAWAVMFPAGTYSGSTITNISVPDPAAMTGTLSVYSGGASAPQTQIATMDIQFTAAGDFVDFTFDQPVTIDPSQNLWIVIQNTSGTDYPAAIAADVTNDPNGRWLYVEGYGWLDMAAAGLSGYSWMIRCTIGDPLSFNIYRNSEIIATVPYTGAEMTYFDQVAIGNYQYQVTAVTPDCESDFALTPDLSQNYVEIAVTSVAEVTDTRIYPNPTTGNVTIEAAGMNHITVVNTLGQVLYDANVNGDQMTMNLGQFKAGVYMLRITTEEGVSVSRVTVTK